MTRQRKPRESWRVKLERELAEQTGTFSERFAAVIEKRQRDARDRQRRRRARDLEAEAWAEFEQWLDDYIAQYTASLDRFLSEKAKEQDKAT
jgi:hypothetical protein